ncbi:MAG: hypothetical protein KatS3mg027_0373 [Bacteroidia bacterium]|nr:MAG: hypothetical protein KatS3mg027_0373 [Bacteroidia bacterium]
MKKVVLSIGVLLSVSLNAQTGFLSKIKNKPVLHPQQNHFTPFQFKGWGNQQVQAAYYLPGKEIYYEWDTIANSWNLIDSTVYTYYTGWPNEGKENTSITYDAPAFTPSSKYFNRYHASSGKWLSQVYYNYDSGSNSWIPNYRDTMIYDSNGRLIEYRGESYDQFTQVWSTNLKRLYTYNSNNKVNEIEEFQIDPNTNALAPYQKKSITYNAQQNIQTITQLDYDQSTNTYTNNSQVMYFYDSSGKANLIYSLDYNSSTNTYDTLIKGDNMTWYKWISSDLLLNDTYLNNNQDNLFSNVEVKFWMAPGNYINFWKIAQNFDPIDDKPTLFSWYNWDFMLSNWVLASSTQINYTRSTTLNNMVTEAIYKQWYNHLNAYRNYARYRYGDPQMMTSVQNFNNTILGLLIYPNPSHGQFVLYLNSHPIDADFNVQIQNLNGQLIQSEYIKNNSTINIVNLPKGMYIIKITDTNNNTAFTKLIVE